MITVLLDSSNSKLNVGLAKDDELIAFTSYECWQQQSEYMVDELDKLLTNNNYSRHDIKDVIVAIGPGSYTGVRIALTIGKVMALALNIPVYEVSSLRILKEGDKPSICVSNARNNRSYFGVYQGGEIIVPDTIKYNDEVINYINEHPDYIVKGNAKYLGYENNEGDILKSMVDLKKYLKPAEDCLSIKPVYLKD